MYAKSLAIASALLAGARAHVEMVMPVPFNPESLNNSPLEPDGSNFPCKTDRADPWAISQLNEYTIGGTGEMRFMGTAVHGGGSCQISITYDMPPTKDSVWKVIKSFEGGCPTRTQTGNYNDPAGATFVNPDAYEFEMPAIPTGEAVFAWTWFNHVGNREMYMNCAPIKISGSGGSQATYDALPDMFRANIGAEGRGCGTTSDTDLLFPDPGAVVETGGAAPNYQPPSNCEQGSGGDRPAPTPPPQQTTEAAPAPTQTEIPGGVFLPDPSISDVPAPSPTEEPENPVVPPPEETQTPEVPEDPVNPPQEQEPEDPVTPPSGEGVMSGACDQEGMWNCVDGMSFQRCASGMWSSPQPMAQGTICKTGMSMDFGMSAARKLKRSAKFRNL